jgi:hypothetical protein
MKRLQLEFVDEVGRDMYAFKADLEHVQEWHAYRYLIATDPANRPPRSLL